MLTAAEARQLVSLSDTHIKSYLDMIDKNIRTLADQGKNTYVCQIDKLSWSEETTRTMFHPPELTPIQLRIWEEVTKLGYKIKWSTYGDKYVPRGLADDDGNGPEYANWCLIISW